MHTIQKTPAWLGNNRYGIRFERLDLRRQIALLLDAFGRQHLHRDKQTGAVTHKKRAALCQQLVKQLRDAGYPIKSLPNLDQRHIRALVKPWQARRLSAATLQSRLSNLCWLATAICKRGLILPPEEYGLGLEELGRSYVAKHDKSLSSAGISADEFIARTLAEDV